MSLIPQLRAAGVECFSRDEWASPRQRDGSYARRRSTHPMPPGPARYHFLHITVTPDTDGPLDGAAGARRVESYGLSTPPMVSYQDLVTNEGRYFEGQNYGTKGTHTVNDKNVPGYPDDLNYYGYATAIMQNVGDEVTDAQVRTIAMIYAARELTGLVAKGAPILPHRTFAWKECPGDKAVARLPEIERLRDDYVKNGLPNPRVRTDARAYYLGAHGAHVKWLGERLIAHGHAPKGFKPEDTYGAATVAAVKRAQSQRSAEGDTVDGFPGRLLLVALMKPAKDSKPALSDEEKDARADLRDARDSLTDAVEQGAPARAQQSLGLVARALAKLRKK